MINFNSFIKQSRLTNRRKNHKPISNNKSYFSNPTSENNSKSKDKYLYTNRTNTSKNSMNIIIQNTLSESNNNKFNNNNNNFNNNNNNFNNNNYYSVNNMCLFNSKIYEQSIDDLFFYLKNFLNFDVYKNVKKFFIETLIENFKIYNNNNNTIKKLKSSFISEVKNNLFYNSYNTINFNNNNNNNLNYKNKNIIENSKENYNSSFYNKNNLKLSYNSTIKHNSLYNLTKNKINSSKSKSNNKTKNNNNTINHKNTKCINKNLFSKINQEIFKIESFRNNKKISLNDLNIVLSTKNKNKSLLNNNNNNNNKTINDTINKIKKYTNKNYSNYNNNNNNNNNYNNNLKENNIKKKMENKIKNNIIKNVNKKEIKSSDYEIKKNSEQLKEIKSSLDDNLKIMFNFSYEYFLNKESETEKSFDNINLLNN